MIYLLSKDTISFPHPSLAMEDGLLAVGGELSVERLILAYEWGIFPWDTIELDDEEVIAWFAPLERFVIFPDKIKISKSMKRILRTMPYTIKVNSRFKALMENCAQTYRVGQEGETWIDDEVIKAYCKLNKLGLAKSIEVYEGDELVGGLYGVISGKVFCGESMFSIKPNASKIALIWLALNGGYELIDCQFKTEHLESMGGESISLEEYLTILRKH